MKPLNNALLSWVMGILLSLVVLGLLFPSSHLKKAGRVAVTQAMIRNFDAALRAYRAEYGKYPSGGLKEVESALRGNNPHGTIFMELLASDLNQAGEQVDPWNTPFRLVPARDATPPQLISAGPDKVFGTQDDITFNKPAMDWKRLPAK